MNIDLKWALPLVAPFVLLGFTRFFFLVAGARWSDTAIDDLVCLLIGFCLGCVAAMYMVVEGIKWTVRIERIEREYDDP